ncbi:MAG: 5-formyltetrahydrofolate cyclo-ligase, partial [Propionibacteriaceae bacterium]|nr:5-formyltetrahydrofolate cyclo-ligase [Propionibacteriaceae bacterium]
MDSLSEADHAALREAKQTLRSAVRTRRSARDDMTMAALDHQRFDWLSEFLDSPGEGFTLATYFSIPPEPSTWELVAWLQARRVTVLLPVLGPRADGSPRREPDWAPYAGPDSLRSGLWGIPEPTTPALGARGLASAEVVVCSALAGTETGKRLGMGGGWFDRALEYAAPDAVFVTLLNDDEIL